MKEINLTGNLGLKWLQNKNYPYTDNIILNKSTSEFDHGGQYGVEIPVINNPNVVEKTIKAIKDKGIYVTRFNETIGSFLLSDQEIKEMLSICYENNYGIIISMGPRPEYDIKGSFYRSQFGLEMGRRINNNDAIKACAEEAIRLAELGCRGITVYDLGILKMLNQMRSDNLLPQEMIFKTSTHCMVTNPFVASIFAENGADSITTAHDLGIPIIHEIRRMNKDLALDIPIDVYKSKGGFIRFYELSEIVQIASPVMLKMGASAQNHPYDSLGEKTIIDRVDRVARGLEILDKYLPNKQQITLKSKHYSLPIKVI